MLPRMLPFVVDLERIIKPSGRSNVKDGGWGSWRCQPPVKQEERVNNLANQGILEENTKWTHENCKIYENDNLCGRRLKFCCPSWSKDSSRWNCSLSSAPWQGSKYRAVTPLGGLLHRSVWATNKHYGVATTSNSTNRQRRPHSFSSLKQVTTPLSQNLKIQIEDYTALDICASANWRVCKADEAGTALNHGEPIERNICSPRLTCTTVTSSASTTNTNTIHINTISRWSREWRSGGWSARECPNPEIAAWVWTNVRLPTVSTTIEPSKRITQLPKWYRANADTGPLPRWTLHYHHNRHRWRDNISPSLLPRYIHSEWDRIAQLAGELWVGWHTGRRNGGDLQMARGNAAHYPDNCGHGNGIQLGTAYLTVAEPVGREVLISRTLGGKRIYTGVLAWVDWFRSWYTVGV